MLDRNDSERIRTMSVRGRLALALTCVERVMERYNIRDERIVGFLDALWCFVECDDLYAAEGAALDVPVTDLLDAYEFEQPIPEAYSALPTFFPEVLYDTIWIARAHMYSAISDYGNESFRLIVRVLELCQQNGVPIPDITSFPFLSFSEEGGWGKPTPRSVFVDIQ